MCMVTAVNVADNAKTQPAVDGWFATYDSGAAYLIGWPKPCQMAAV
jgi:hypothetical protein